MRSAFLFSVLAVLALPPLCQGQAHIGGASSPYEVQDPAPVAVVPELITHLPSDLPQRVSGFAYDGEKFWVMIYLGRGKYATLNPVSLTWNAGDLEEHQRAIREIAGSFQSPSGICFAGNRLWVTGSYGDSFGFIDTQDWTIGRVFKGKLRDDPATQSYAGLACDGHNLWIAWHWTNYKLPPSDTQLLLKVDPDTGKILEQYAAPPGNAADMTHGLTWDGTKLWHMKDSTLSAIDPETGRVTAQYIVERIKRPSGLAWDGKSLWIVEFGGEVWRVHL